MHRPRRIGLRLRYTRDRRQRGSAGGQMQKISAGEVQFPPPPQHSNTPSARSRKPPGMGPLGTAVPPPPGGHKQGHDPLRVFVFIEAADAGLTGFRTIRVYPKDLPAASSAS